MRPLVAIVGCGKIARKHARSLKGEVDLIFYSRNFESAQKMNEEFEGRGAIQGWNELLSNSSIRAALISSPPDAHFNQIKDLWRAGVSVYCEKPLCIESSELAEIENLIQQRYRPGQFLMVAENYYYKPSLEWIKSQISSGVIGNLKRVHVQKMFTQGSRTWKAKMGSLLEGGIHFVSLMNDLCDPHLQNSGDLIEAKFPNRFNQSVERTAHLELRFVNGIEAHLDYSWESPSRTKGLFQHSRIVGDRGEIIFESNGLYEMLKSKSASLGISKFQCHLSDISGHEGMTKDFLKCLREGAEPYSNFLRAKRDLGLIFSAYGDQLQNHERRKNA